MIEFNTLFLYFFLYSLLGWICEEIFCRIIQGKWTNRGFLSGPYCPIYGFGGLIVVFFLQPLKMNFMYIFLLSMLITSILEYMTSFLMENFFNAKWWDYTDTPFNINGRICLPMSILFGLLGVIVTYFIHPYVTSLIQLVPIWFINYLVGGLFTLFIADIVTTLSTILNLKEKLYEAKTIAEKIAEKSKDKVTNSEIIRQLEEVKNSIISKTNVFHDRLIEAFPSLEFKKYGNQLDELKVLIHEKESEKKMQKAEKKEREKELKLEKKKETSENESSLDENR